MAIEQITNYLDIPLSQALSEKYGGKLEQLTAPDKLDIAHAILTTLAWNDNENQEWSIDAVTEEVGLVSNNATQTEQTIKLIDAHNVSPEDLLGLAALLCLHLQMGVYADAE